MTFDGPKVNILMSSHLGASVKNLQSEITVRDKGEPINILLDPSHMIKLVRNTLGDYKVLKHEKQEIKWQYVYPTPA